VTVVWAVEVVMAFINALAMFLDETEVALAVVEVVVALATKNAVTVVWAIEVVVAFINALAMFLDETEVALAVVEVVVAGSSVDLAGMSRAASMNHRVLRSWAPWVNSRMTCKRTRRR